MKAKLVIEPFVPSHEEEFYYKPSEKWNYLVWCDKKYLGYFIRVYNEIPPRINPVHLNLIDEIGNTILRDIRVELSEDILGDILDRGGDCQIKMKKSGIYLLGKKCDVRTN